LGSRGSLREMFRSGFYFSLQSIFIQPNNRSNKTYNPTPVLVKEDKAIKEFRKWFVQFYDENSNSMEEEVEKEMRESIEW